MKTILATLTADIAVCIGNWTLFQYDDGSITARQYHSGLMLPDQRPTLAGLRRLLCWIDAQPH